MKASGHTASPPAAPQHPKTGDFPQPKQLNHDTATWRVTHNVFQLFTRFGDADVLDQSNKSIWRRKFASEEMIIWRKGQSLSKSKSKPRATWRVVLR